MYLRNSYRTRHADRWWLDGALIGLVDLLVAAGERREMALRCVRNKGEKHPLASRTGKDHFFSLLAVAAAVACCWSCSHAVKCFDVLPVLDYQRRNIMLVVRLNHLLPYLGTPRPGFPALRFGHSWNLPNDSHH
jgi:hypothetical protein